MKFILGITGGTGSGKSTVTAYIKECGAKIADADIVARQIVMPGKPALKEIKDAFGDKVILPNGTLNRKKVGSIVFSDSEKLNILNSITHKYIIEEIKAFTVRNEGLIVIDAALLFQTGLDGICDKTLVVTAAEEVRRNRIAHRDGISEEHAKNRIASQNNEEYYIERADYIIVNDGTLDDLKSKTERILKEIM